jgi:hypothetical protein
LGKKPWSKWRKGDGENKEKTGGKMKTLAMIIYAVCGAISFFWSMGVIIQNLGFFGGLVALTFFPLTILFAPFYVGFSTGNWALLAITYGGGIIAIILSSMLGEE